MARTFVCRICRVELERVELAGARAVVVCIECETMGFAHEAVHGAPHWPADLGASRGRKNAGTANRSTAAKRAARAKKAV